MLALYIIAPIVIFIALIVWGVTANDKRKRKEWLLEIHQWEIGDIVDLSWNNDTRYYCIDHNASYTAYQYRGTAKKTYAAKFPNNSVEGYVKLVKWDAVNCVIEFCDGDKIHMSTKFIKRNITYHERLIDKSMDTFVLNKQQKIQKLRKDKLLRILEDE